MKISIRQQDFEQIDNLDKLKIPFGTTDAIRNIKVTLYKVSNINFLKTKSKCINNKQQKACMYSAYKWTICMKKNSYMCSAYKLNICMKKIKNYFFMRVLGL